MTGLRPMVQDAVRSWNERHRNNFGRVLNDVDAMVSVVVFPPCHWLRTGRASSPAVVHADLLRGAVSSGAVPCPWHARPDRTISTVKTCRVCAADAEFLRSKERPAYEAATPAIRVVDLFSGGGGLSLGAAEAARRLGLGTRIALAVEEADAPADVFVLNFPKANLVRSDVSKVFDGELGSPWTHAERRVAGEVGEVDLLVAGPPCQGHSDLNNHTRRRDPRNALYLSAVRAAEVLRPTFVLVENVPAVELDRGGVVRAATCALEAAGYTVANAVLALERFGVPQRRRRHILLAALGNLVDPSVVLTARSVCETHGPRTVEWAIRDLASRSAVDGPDAPTVATAVNRMRMQWLIDNGEYDLPNSLRPECHHGSHRYVSMYGRLRWDAPAQTITTGFGSMGQGRFVHPSKPRTLTPHEAARLQTLPDFFDLDLTKGRGAWAAVIGNAVPPLLGVHIVEPLLCAVVPAEASAATPPPGTTTPRANRAPRNGVPPASSEVIRVRMATTKRRDTGPELALRSELHRLGLRFFVDRQLDRTRRRADIVFPTERVAVYVDGCFWHQCPVHGTVPRQNRDWWIEKLDANSRRDADTDARLAAAGWAVLRFWEHDDPMSAACRVRDAVLARRPALTDSAATSVI